MNEAKFRYGKRGVCHALYGPAFGIFRSFCSNMQTQEKKIVTFYSS